MDRRRRSPGLVGAVAVVVLASSGCGNGLSSSALDEAEQRWSDASLSAYSFTLTSSCGERALIGTFVVSVADGEVSDAQAEDDSAAWVVEDQPELIPTIDDLFTLLHDAGDADRVTASYDADLGYPTSIEIDRDAAGIDDEECYTVTDLS